MPNLAARSIRLTALAASREFHADRRTLQRKLAEAEIEPGADERFSIFDVFSALSCSSRVAHEVEKQRLTKAQADTLELRLEQERGELISIDYAFGRIENIGIAIRRIIVSSPLSQNEKDQILAELRRLDDGEILKPTARELAAEGSPAGPDPSAT